MKIKPHKLCLAENQILRKCTYLQHRYCKNVNFTKGYIFTKLKTQENLFLYMDLKKNRQFAKIKSRELCFTTTL